MDIEDLLRLLKEHNVKFVIIGAAAFPVHGYARSTLDVDLFIESSEENAKNCLLALKEFGYDMSDITTTELLKKKILIRQYVVEVDIHPYVKGVKFEDLWRHKVIEQYGKTETYFASLDDLIKMKRAAGRPIDKEDLKVLLKLKEKKQK
jgi:predicted nucleotidyltransferase